MVARFGDFGGSCGDRISLAAREAFGAADLADYFGAELKTLPPTVAHLPLFEKIRASIKKLQPILSKSPEALTRADIGLIRTEASGLNEAIRRGE